MISTVRTSPIAPNATAPNNPILDVITEMDFSRPVRSATELRQQGYDENLVGWSAHAEEMPQFPHAASLVKLLREASSDVIRQLPSAARDALAFCDDPNVSRSRLASLLGKDPALVLRLLRAANSAAMGSGKPVLALDGAIARIGMASTRSVVLAHCVDGLLSRPGLPFEDMSRKVWDHMISTGPIARAIAPAFCANSEEAFSVALLHDVGKLVVFDQISALRARQRSPVLLPTSWLSAFIQDIHESLGALAALRWGMGERAAAAIGSHHRASVRGPDALAETVFAAERVDHAQRQGVAVEMKVIFQHGQLTGSVERVEQLLAIMASDES